MSGRENTSRSVYPVQMFLVAATVATVTLTLANIAWFTVTVHVARLRELELLSLLRFGLERADLNPLALLPDIVSRPFEMGDPSALCQFVLLGLGFSVLASALAALILMPLVFVMAWLVPPTAQNTAQRWWWERAFPAAVIIGFLLPAARVPLLAALARWGRPGLIGWGLAGSLLTWGVLLGLFGRRRRTVRILLTCAVLEIGFTAIAVSGMAVDAIVRPHDEAIAQPPASPQAPNILLVSIDSLRRDHVHCYGYPRDTTPVIDTLARDGTMFRTVVSPASWTLPAHLTLLTSLPPEEHGVVDDGSSVRESVVFLAEVLWRSGYTTAGFVSAPYLDAAYGFSQGFDHYDDYTVAKATFKASDSETKTSPALETLAGDWLTQWNHDGRQRPFFIFLHMWDVHYDYTPPAPYDTMFDPDYHGSVDGRNFIHNEQVHAGMDARDLAHVIALYDGEIRFTDTYLGRVLGRLRGLGVLDNTLVVVTADHGDEFFEHGRKGHAKTLYDESVLVPLVMRFPPKVPAGTVVDSQVRLMDVGPTILALVGLGRPQDFGSKRLRGAEAPQDLSRWMNAARPAALPPLTAFGDLELADAPAQITSIRTDGHKLIEPLHDSARAELYDLQTDPGEHANLTDVGAPPLKALRDQLAAWHAVSSDGRQSQAVVLSQEHRELLRALGYLK